MSPKKLNSIQLGCWVRSTKAEGMDLQIISLHLLPCRPLRRRTNWRQRGNSGRISRFPGHIFILAVKYFIWYLYHVPISGFYINFLYQVSISGVCCNADHSPSRRCDHRTQNVSRWTVWTNARSKVWTAVIVIIISFLKTKILNTKH